jgi:hypothetical protein
MELSVIFFHIYKNCVWDLQLSLCNFMNIIYEAGHKGASIILFQRSMPILLVLIIFWCGYKKCSSILYKGDSLELTISCVTFMGDGI